MSKIKIKICGLSREADIDAVNEAMPDYIGFVFAPSRRQVTPQQALQLRKRLSRGILPVGVFVNAEIDLIERLHGNGVIKLAQLHGEEDQAYINLLRRVCGIPVIKAVRPGQARDIQADFLLLDSGAGSGKVFDWNLLHTGTEHSEATQLRRRRWFLAGGISLENIDEALACHPYAIDLSSGAETNGVKDRAKILALTEKVRRSNV